jgi:hypothetical protein
MKQKRLACFAAVMLAALLSAGCDMETVAGYNANAAPAASADHNYLTITNLPYNAQEFNVANVYIWNQAGKIGECEDYSQLFVSQSGPAATLRIPLWYTGLDQKFTETGTYFVSFDLNIDALTRIKVSEKEKIHVAFLNGNGTLDASGLPQPETLQYFAVTGLPPNTSGNGFSDVFLYNAAGKVAKCADYDEITVAAAGAGATAYIPMVRVDDSNEPFRNTGSFIIEFSVDIDAYTQIYITRDILLTSNFVNGAGIFKMTDFLGYFDGSLTNPGDTLPPVITRNTKFEMNGSFYKLDSDTSLPSPPFTKTSLAYLYAVPIPAGFDFEYSTEPPVFSPAKNGYYQGVKRALWKFVYIRDTVNQYAAKTFINDGFTQFGHYTVSDSLLGQPPDSSIIYTLPGTGNPAPQTVTLSPGAYIVTLKGAGGGGGSNISGYPGGAGGGGGFAAEVLTLNQASSFTAYTGQGGNASNSSGGGTSFPVSGGGGAAAFLYSPGGYFLCAGGGGGGTSANYFTTTPGDIHWGAGGGGGGGSVGNGSASGKFLIINGTTAPGAPGGGYPYTLYSTGSGYNGTSSNFVDLTIIFGIYEDGAAVPYAAYAHALDLWKNTNGANGQGANAGANTSAPGGHGGNNRNGQRGGGAPGGAGAAAGLNQGPGQKGGDGSVVIYSLNGAP